MAQLPVGLEVHVRHEVLELKVHLRRDIQKELISIILFL